MTKLAFVLDNGRELQIPLAADMPLGRLAEVTAAVQDVEMLHQERMQSLGLLSARHERACSDLAKVNSRYHEVSAEVNRLQAIEAELRHELQTLAARKEQSLTALQELSGRRAVEEDHLKSLEEKTMTAGRVFDETTSAAETAQGALQALLENLSQAREQQEQLYADITTRTGELQQTEAKLHQVKMQHDCVEDRRAMLAVASEDLAFGNEQLQAVQTEIEANIASLTVEEQTARQAAGVADAARQDAAESLRKTEAELCASRANLKQLNEQTAVARETLASTEACQTRLTQVLASQQERQAKLQDSICALETLLADRQTVLVAVEKDLGETKRQLAQARDGLSSTQKSLNEHEQQLRAKSAELEDKNRKVTIRSEELAGLSAMLERRHAEEREAEARLSSLTSQIESSQQQFTDASAKLATTNEEHTRLANEIGVHQDTIDAQQKKLEIALRERAAAENQTAALRDRETALLTSIEALLSGEKTQRQRYDELRSLTTAAEHEHANRMKENEEQLASTRQELQEVEGRLEALEAWNQRMIGSQNRLASLLPDSLEARNLRNDIDVSMAGLRHLLSKGASAVAPPPLSAHADAAAESQPQEKRAGVNPRARIQSQAGSAMREHDRQLEDKIRQNEVRLELLERRLKRGELEERCQREKIASLKQRLGEIAGNISERVPVRA
ncbi:hypothetical protein [Prosthecobacter sp.]|uniref:hypothetical protein n=1 Tax=Prosthecobacter sp. TaxID=1965333 RepID=UPI001D6D47D6|nr:hypothetical protein [Prosthecobacter sp.]MCB1276264.1 hypothetical protein [Prosthecobacter sp.]